MVLDLPDGYERGNNEVDKYAKVLQVLTTNVVGLKATSTFNLPIGILRRIEIYFPYGCLYHLFATVHQGATLVVPNALSPDIYVIGNDKLFVFDMFKYITPATVSYTISGWNDGTCNWNHNINVNILIEKVVVP